MAFAGTFVGTCAVSDLINGYLKVFVKKMAGTGSIGTGGNTFILHGPDLISGSFNDSNGSSIRNSNELTNQAEASFGTFPFAQGIYVQIQICHPSIKIDSVTVTFAVG
jgi:hypothetical protein